MKKKYGSVLLLLAITGAIYGCGGMDPVPADASAGGGCPAGRGPSMVLVKSDDSVSFCMDSTEVTKDQYDAFVASGERPATLRPACDANKDFKSPAECLAITPACTGPGCGKRPQVCIDYCDAEAFCAWSGKTLCGTANGKELTEKDLQSPWTTVWARACRGLTSPSDKGTTFSYGDTFEPETCNAPQRTGTGCKAAPDSCHPTEAGSLPNCQSRGAYQGIYDLTSNVGEFLFAVVKNSAGRDLAQWAPANYLTFSGNDVYGCLYNTGVGGGYALTDANEFTGFRCCATPK